MKALRDEVIGQKLGRLRAGAPPRVLDLFSGCGGLSLGFQKAGFEIVAAVENNPNAADSHAKNFHAGDRVHAEALDITQLKPSELARKLGLGRVAEAVDVIVGGPPCQAFARVGRSKLREIDEHPEAFLHDPRAQLYAHYLAYVRAFKPLAILMENVPDVMNFGGHNLPEEVCGILEGQGYTCAYTLLNAAFYGVPQMRERMFLVAYRRELTNTVSFPDPSHWIELPSGYTGSRNVALKQVNAAYKSNEIHHFVKPPESNNLLPSAISAHDAIGDLPVIRAREMLAAGTLRRGTRRLDQMIAYDSSRPVSDYVQKLNNWRGFELEDGICDHVIRYLPRDYDIFALMNPGDQYPQAYEHALHLFEAKKTNLRAAGQKYDPRSQKYANLRKSTVPPYDHTKFPNKWRKMWKDLPARTIMAHLGKDSYSHIHYDSRQARTISVREAARLQSFPDGFKFAGAMNQAFQQIGNSVPPLLSFALARTMKQSLNQIGSQSAVKKDTLAVV